MFQSGWVREENKEGWHQSDSKRRCDLKGKLEAFEHDRQNRFEPAIRFILEAKQATILLAEGNQEKNLISAADQMFAKFLGEGASC